MLKIILIKLIPQAEEIIAVEQAGFRTGSCTTEQIFNPETPVRKVAPTSAADVPCLHYFSKMPLTEYGM